MAIGQNLLFGRMRKSVGNITTCTWNGLNIIKSKPISVRQNVTPAVKLNRDKLATVSKAVSKIGSDCKYIFNLGVQKTTAFAEIQKFFRQRITNELFLDKALFMDSSVGSSNCSISNFPIGNSSYDNFYLDLTNLIAIPELLQPNTKFSILMVNQDLSTIFFKKDICNFYDDYLSFSPADYGFVVGDRVLYAIKAVSEKPGQLLTSALTFSGDDDFTELYF